MAYYQCDEPGHNTKTSYGEIFSLSDSIMKKSPLAPAKFPAFARIDGVLLGAVESGARYRGRDDLMLAVLEEGTTVAGVLTRSATAAAPVLWCRRQLANHDYAPRALLVNSGNANAFTGAAGAHDAWQMGNAVAAEIGCAPEQILLASTGVIGEPLPLQKIIAALPPLIKVTAKKATTDDVWQRAATAILTTDTFAKGATAHAMIAGTPVSINGFAKGSGMIEPDMATMLAFLFTDAAIPRAALQAMLVAANQRSFNCITVDSDTSTNDTCLLFATGKAGNPPPRDAHDPVLDDFKKVLAQVMTDLALQVVRDGEGAQKLIRIQVRGAESDRAAKVIAKSIANSPLVKTAIAGQDANWGRIIMAVGKAGMHDDIAIDPSRIGIKIGGIAVAAQGKRVDDFDETPLNAHLAGDEILIEVELGGTHDRGDRGDRGNAPGNAHVWTCDLTHGYIDINADYRT